MVAVFAQKQIELGSMMNIIRKGADCFENQNQSSEKMSLRRDLLPPGNLAEELQEPGGRQCRPGRRQVVNEFCGTVEMALKTNLCIPCTP